MSGLTIGYIGVAAVAFALSQMAALDNARGGEIKQ